MKVLHAAGVAALLAFSAPALAADSRAGAARSAELVLAGRADVERLQEAARAGLLGPEHPADGQEVEGRARRDRLPGHAVQRSRSRRAATVFGTPTAEAHDVPRAQVPRSSTRDFLNTPQALNHFQTMNRYWMEDSFGKYGVQLDAFGPYQLPGPPVPVLPRRPGGGQPHAHCPDAAPAKPCNLNFRTDARAAWARPAVGAAKIAEYDNVFYVSAGEDESSTWQEFGEMKWMTQEEVPDAFGPKAFGDPLQTNWAVDALRAVDLVGLGGDQLAERLGQHVGRGRELGHVDLRPRAVAQPRRSPTTTATRTAPRSSAASPACGT